SSLLVMRTSFCILFSALFRPPPPPTLFPYTTLFQALDPAPRLLFGRAGLGLHLGLGLAHRLLQLRGRLAGLVHAALELFGRQFALELGLHRVPLRARAPDPQPREARRLGQALGAE